MGRSQKLYVFIPYRSNIKNPDVLQHNGIKNSEIECACGVSTWKLLPLKMESMSNCEVVRECFLQELMRIQYRSWQNLLN